MDEPEKSQAVLDRMKEIQAEAGKNDHSLREWKWDGYGCWRTGCENRNCLASVWVAVDGSCNGKEVETGCWIKEFYAKIRNKITQHCRQ